MSLESLITHSSFIFVISSWFLPYSSFICVNCITHTPSHLLLAIQSEKSLIPHSSFIFVVSSICLPHISFTFFVQHSHSNWPSWVWTVSNFSQFSYLCSFFIIPSLYVVPLQFLLVISSSGVIYTTHTLRPLAVIQESSLLFLLSSGAGHTTHLLFLTRFYDSENTFIPHTGSLIWGEGPFFVWSKLEWLGEVMEEFLEEALLWFSSGGLRL